MFLPLGLPGFGRATARTFPRIGNRPHIGDLGPAKFLYRSGLFFMASSRTFLQRLRFPFPFFPFLCFVDRKSTPSFVPLPAIFFSRAELSTPLASFFSFSSLARGVNDAFPPLPPSNGDQLPPRDSQFPFFGVSLVFQNHFPPTAWDVIFLGTCNPTSMWPFFFCHITFEQMRNFSPPLPEI